MSDQLEVSDPTPDNPAQNASESDLKGTELESLSSIEEDESSQSDTSSSDRSKTSTVITDGGRERIIKQHEARWPWSDPPVIYEVEVFDKAIPTRKRHRLSVRYQDDRPFKFIQSMLKQTAHVHTTPSNVSTSENNCEGLPTIQEDTVGGDWPAFFVDVDADAKFRRTRRRGGVKRRIVPENAEDLPLHTFRELTIVVVSSPLKLALRALIGYYPSFWAISDSPSSNISIKEPFGVVMHHFRSIKQLVEGDCIDSREKDSFEPQLAEQKRHLKFLYEFAEPLHLAHMVPCEQHLSEAYPRVAFDMLWFLLKPGIDVYIQSEDMTFAGVVFDVRRGQYNNDNYAEPCEQNEQDCWIVDLWHLVTDGARIQRTLKWCRIDQYSGLRGVTELPVCPASFWDKKDDGKRREKMLARSRTFFKALQQGSLLTYHDGPVRGTNGYYTGKVVLDHRRGAAETGDRNSHEIFSVDDYDENYTSYNNIQINDDQDFFTYESRMHPQTEELHSPRFVTLQNAPQIHPQLIPRPQHPSPPPPPYHRPYLDSQRIGVMKRYMDTTSKSPNDKSLHTTTQELTDHQLILLHPKTYVYGLKLKQWMVTSVDYVQESTPSSESLENLVIGEDERQTIRALSNKQNGKAKQWSADFIDGKGSGQIILLHGPPGVGKTYTVEAISEWLNRPLLALTVADIGTVETRVEQQLFRWFGLAEAWDAVLLVDEADIFLERRQNRDLGRNGLVSAFLRRMEYFKGLLFLTTNRVGQIDDAFISRVHVSIGYDSLNAKMREEIWRGFFTKLATERAGKIQVAPDAKKWVLETTGDGQAQLNGRDIRNALQTAITLAEFESEEDTDFSPEMVIIVTKSHFQRVLEMSNKFHNYVTSIRRQDEKNRAHGRGDRNDYDGYDAPSNEMSILRQRRD